MGLYFFSLDYLVGVVQRLHKEKILSKSSFYNRTGINVIFSRMAQTGLIRLNTNPLIRDRHYRGNGRHAKLYQLNVDYDNINLGDLYPLLTKVGRHEEHVYRLMEDVPVSRLEARHFLSAITASSSYSASKMLDMLFFLSVDKYTRCDDMACLVSQPSHRRAILSDLVKVGVVEVMRGYGYKLKKPLNSVRIRKLLPLMYSKSPRKQTYNTLISLMQDMPVEILDRTTEGTCTKQ